MTGCCRVFATGTQLPQSCCAAIHSGTPQLYSYLCTSLRAGEYWTVMLCKEAADRAAIDCGNQGLTLYGNGTLLPQSFATWQLNLDSYQVHTHHTCSRFFKHH